MALLRVHLLGQFEIVPDGPAPAGLDASKLQELLCYLLLHRDRPHPRETLASLLWAESSTTRSRAYLRKALWQLQTALVPQAQPGSQPVLLVEPDWVRINPDADLWLDVAAFEDAFALVKGMSGTELDAQRVQALKSAVDLYQGDLLESWYHDWCLYERERLQHMYLAMLDKLMEHCEAQQKYEAGLLYGMRILAYDRAREHTHRRIMRLYCCAGNRTAALRQFEHCVAALKEELDVQPSKRTISLYDQIRADKLPRPTLTPAEATTSAQTPASLPEVLSQLKQLQTALTDTQDQIQRNIDAVERALNG